MRSDVRSTIPAQLETISHKATQALLGRGQAAKQKNIYPETVQHLERGGGLAPRTPGEPDLPRLALPCAAQRAGSQRCSPGRGIGQSPWAAAGRAAFAF